MACCGDDTYCFMDYPRAGIFIGKLCIVISLICALLELLSIVFYDEIMEMANIDKQFVKKNKDAYHIFAGFSVSAFIINIIVSVVMMIGIKKELYVLLLPWLIFHAIAILFTLVNTFSVTIFAAIFHLIILGFFVWAWYGIGIIFKHLHRHSSL